MMLPCRSHGESRSWRSSEAGELVSLPKRPGWTRRPCATSSPGAPLASTWARSTASRARSGSAPARSGDRRRPGRGLGANGRGGRRGSKRGAGGGARGRLAGRARPRPRASAAARLSRCYLDTNFLYAHLRSRRGATVGPTASWRALVTAEMADGAVISALMLDELAYRLVLAWLRDDGERDPLSAYRRRPRGDAPPAAAASVCDRSGSSCSRPMASSSRAPRR